VTERIAPDLQVVRRGAGYAAWGSGFYVWDVDAGELLREAGALARAVRGRTPGGGAPSDPQGAHRARASSASRRRASIAAR
jgi:hypothetical protein